MSTGLIIAIVIAALILLALFWFVGRKGRERRLETRRHEAREIGREAELSRAEADRTRAEADAQSAEARRQDALARERAAEADERHREARERHIEAAKKHPDMDEDEAAEQFDREQAARDDTVYEGGAISHQERTETPDVERERRFERNEQGEVVRDEEYEEPRR
jgi:F0F1-type ATP synthase membrane subunit b/b'